MSVPHTHEKRTDGERSGLAPGSASELTEEQVRQLVAEMPVTELGNLACPFCGGVKLSRLSPKNAPLLQWVQCDTCGATGPNTAEANEGWNTRAFGPHAARRLNAEVSNAPSSAE